MRTTFINCSCAVLIFVMTGNFALAQTSDKMLNVEGEGQFLSRPSDEWQFVKRNLYATATEDIYSKVLTEIGLDKELFWKKYEARFEEAFRPTADELKKKYGFQDEKNLEKLPKYAQYENELREARLNQRAKFGSLSRTIVSYSEKRQSRSTANPNLRFLTLGAKVDPAAINASYYRFTSDNKTRNFNSLYVSVVFSLKGLEWKDLGVAMAGDFTTVVEEHWRKWLEDALKSQIGEVKIITPGQLEDVQAYLKSEGELSDHPGPQGGAKKLPAEFEDALLMKIQVHIDGQGPDEAGTGINIKIDGDHVLIDLKTRDIVHSQDFTPAVHRIAASDAQTLSSNVASTVYRIPLTSWETLGKAVATLPEANGNIVLAIQKVASISNIYALLDFLAQKGAGQGFQGKLETYDGQQAKILLRYQGDVEKVFEILKKLQDVDVNKNLTLHFDDLAQPFVMSLKPKVLSEGEKLQ